LLRRQRAARIAERLHHVPQQLALAVLAVSHWDPVPHCRCPYPTGEASSRLHQVRVVQLILATVAQAVATTPNPPSA